MNKLKYQRRLINATQIIAHIAILRYSLKFKLLQNKF